MGVERVASKRSSTAGTTLARLAWRSWLARRERTAGEDRAEIGQADNGNGVAGRPDAYKTACRPTYARKFSSTRYSDLVGAPVTDTVRRSMA